MNDDIEREAYRSSEEAVQLLMKIQSAAIRVLGKTFAGWSHDSACDHAHDELGLDFSRAYTSGKVEKGFLTDTGELVDRQQAMTIALAADQVTDKYLDCHALQSYMLKF
jgi:hypothetical protein